MLLGRIPVVVALLLLSLALSGFSGQASAPPAPGLTGKYVVAFLACNTSTANCGNPANHKTYLAQSNDSIAWTPLAGFTPYQGSVPDLVRRGNTLYVYNPGRLTRHHLDTGVQEQGTPVNLRFANGSTAAGFVDPSVMLDGNGTIVLFYLPAVLGQDPAQCPSGQTRCTKYMMSATEVAGSDGSAFVVDPDVRVGLQISTCCASDPAVFQGPKGYYLYVSEGQSVLAFSSSSLRGAYAPVAGLSGGVLVQQGTGGVPAGYYDSSSGSFLTFVTQGTLSVIARASTSSINSSIPAASFSTVLSGCDFPGLGCSYMVGSPGFHLNVAGVTRVTTTTTAASSASTSAVPEFANPASALLATAALVALLAALLSRRGRGSSARLGR